MLTLRYRWTGGPWQLVADRLVQLGVFVSISAGNFGDVGSWYASSGSTGTDVLAVASIDNEELYVTGALVRTDDVETIVVSAMPLRLKFEAHLTNDFIEIQ